MKRNAFTLIELLIVVAIIMLLAGMLLPALKSTRERARQIQCASNMKQCGYAMASYASDFNNYVILEMYKLPGSNWYKGGSARWVDMLNGTWDVEYLKDKTVVLCPSFAPMKYESPSFIYGARLTGFPATSAEVAMPGCLANATTVVSLPRLLQPATYLMLGDSYSSTYSKQIYVINSNASPSGFHMRHSNRQGNILAGDFHVEGVGRVKAVDWGMTGGYIGTDLITF